MTSQAENAVHEAMNTTSPRPDHESPPGSSDITDMEMEIIGQVEYLFSDENLPNDARMLGLTGGSENWPVNVGRLTGFGRLRDYRPKKIVGEALKKSTFLEFTDKTHVRRRIPLALPPSVEPELIPGKNAPPLIKEPKVKGDHTTTTVAGTGSTGNDLNQPRMTKGMLKPTGFEEYFADAPITPAQHDENQRLYGPDTVFSVRIEKAIQRYSARRKFHTETRRAFDLWMSYGGIHSGQKQFTGKSRKEDMGEMDAQEIAEAMATHHVADSMNYTDKWVVDFPGVARGFLSFDTILRNTSGSASFVKNFVNVITNFYRWLLQHDVCPEYDSQIREAMDICKIATVELTKAVQLAALLPCDYNRACSAVSGGSSALLLRDDSQENVWSSGGEITTMKRSDAEMAVVSAVALLGTAQHRELLSQKPKQLAKTTEEEMSLQVTGIEFADDALQSKFDEEKKINNNFRPLGKMHCCRLDDMMDKPHEKDQRTFTFWIEQETLSYCFVGMKIQAMVCENNIGCLWLDRVLSINASYYHSIPNDFFDKSDDAILPKEWYRRQRSIKEHGYKRASENEFDSMLEEV